jgi:hypothetical protein
MTTVRIVVDEIEAGPKNDASRRTIAASGWSTWTARCERGALRVRHRGEERRSSRVPRSKRRLPSSNQSRRTGNGVYAGAGSAKNRSSISAPRVCAASWPR